MSVEMEVEGTVSSLTAARCAKVLSLSSLVVTCTIVSSSECNIDDICYRRHAFQCQPIIFVDEISKVG